MATFAEQRGDTSEWMPVDPGNWPAARGDNAPSAAVDRVATGAEARSAEHAVRAAAAADRAAESARRAAAVAESAQEAARRAGERAGDADELARAVLDESLDTMQAQTRMKAGVSSIFRRLDALESSRERREALAEQTSREWERFSERADRVVERLVALERPDAAP
jgi:hypothetical protein